jgi:hypothetical protein
MEGGERRSAGAARLGQAAIGSVGLGQGTGAVDREPAVEGAILPLGNREMGFDQRARTDLAGA